MYSFSDLTIDLLNLWSRDPEWAEAIEEADEIERPLIHAQRLLARWMKFIQTEEASPEVLAWLSLWSRLFGVIDGARGAYQRQALLALTAVERMAFELALHLHLILEPLGKKDGEDSPPRETVIERLRAYFAWCAFSDLQYWTKWIDEENLTFTYDPKPGRELAQLHEGATNGIRELFGEHEVLSDQEAELDKARARDSAAAQIHVLSKLLADDRLQPYVAKLQSLSSNRRGQVQLYELFDENERSVFRRLDATGIRHGYLRYQRTSAVIHGSSFDQSVAMVGWTVFPLYGASDDQLRMAVENVTRSANSCVATLLLLIPSRFPRNS
jgi:hypothetical protein